MFCLIQARRPSNIHFMLVLIYRLSIHLNSAEFRQEFGEKWSELGGGGGGGFKDENLVFNCNVASYIELYLGENPIQIWLAVPEI